VSDSALQRLYAGHQIRVGDAVAGIVSGNVRKLARQPSAAQPFGTPKMPGEPKRVRPSRDTDLKGKNKPT
jgi:hypothetical protein